MELSQLYALYKTHPQLLAGRLLLSKSGENLFLKGLSGSIAALALTSLIEEGSRSMVVIHEDAEMAGYMYHDLVQLHGEDRVLFYPASFKRALKYGRNDPGNTILRTEVLQALQQDKGILVVTYPDALLEKVVLKSDLKKNTLSVKSGERIDNAFVIELLHTFGFERVDYVYEPGQFAVRGSLIDVYSWNHEQPCRIDFFGDEVESIRYFEIESQLSAQSLDEFRIVPFTNNDNQELASFLEYLKPTDILSFSDYDFAVGRLRMLLDEPGDTPVNKLLDWRDFEAAATKHTWIEFGKKAFHPKHTVLTFETAPQDVFGKNFEFVSEAFHRYTERGYQLFVLSDSIKQIERLRAIFEDREEDLHFTPLTKTLHEGFVDHDLKVACFTDHQLFERYHKYNLRSDKARNGKLALTLKEIVQFQFGDYVVHIDHGVGRFAGLFRTEVNGKMQEVIKIVYKDDDTICTAFPNTKAKKAYPRPFTNWAVLPGATSRNAPKRRSRTLLVT